MDRGCHSGLTVSHTFQLDLLDASYEERLGADVVGAVKTNLKGVPSGLCNAANDDP